LEQKFTKVAKKRSSLAYVVFVALDRKRNSAD